jgi:hypothetical protein
MKNYAIEIQNIGPIKDVKIDLNKVNVFMGAQSSGKSTIAKIISFCSWVEKDVSVHQSFKSYNDNPKYFIERLETFHKMKGYFSKNSKIKFTSTTLDIDYSNQNLKISWVDRFAYMRSKISYIPAERSIAILPEIEKVEFPNNYLKSFLFDWLDARKNYSNNKKLPLLDIDAEFYYSESAKESHISNHNKKYDILLSQASSGLQSITPLLVMIDHLTKSIYDDDQNMSYLLDEVRMKVNQKLINEFVVEPLYGPKDLNNEKKISKVYQDIIKKLEENDKIVTANFAKVTKLRNQLFKTHSTNIILEEPEQNLFPSTQKSLIYAIFNALNNNSAHFLTLTTHSPYVLYAINNCILAYLTNEKLAPKNSYKLHCKNSKIQPDLISIYELKDGKIENIQQKDGLIGENFFDIKMREVMDEFYLMLNHY